MNLEERAVRCAEHMNEYFDKEDLNIYVLWSTQQHYYPFTAMIFLHDQAKADNKKGCFQDSITHYMVRTRNYFYAKEAQKQDGKNTRTTQNT